MYINSKPHEAELYMVLLVEGSLTSYETVKLTFIVRSNTF